MSIRQPSYNKERIDKYCIHTIAGCVEKENMRFAVVYENPTEVVNSNKIWKVIDILKRNTPIIPKTDHLLLFFSLCHADCFDFILIFGLKHFYFHTMLIMGTLVRNQDMEAKFGNRIEKT